MTSSRLLLIVIVLCMPTLSAHEGHQPLPTRGVQVDLARGRITVSSAAVRLIDVQTQPAEQRIATEQLVAYATLMAPWTQNAVITSRLPGRVVSLRVRPGDMVEKDQVVAEVESRELYALRLEYEESRNAIELSQRLLESLEPAAKAGAVAGQRLFEAQLELKQAQNTLRVLRAKAFALSVTQEELEPATSDESDSGNLQQARGVVVGPQDAPAELLLAIRSPISGVIAHSDLAVGKVVEPTEHLMDVVDLSTVWVRIDVLERDWHRVKIGQQVRLTLSGFPGAVFETHIDTLGQMLDPDSHQNVAWASLHNSSSAPEFRPGMKGQVELQLSGEQAVMSVPAVAVQSDGAERYVLVEEASTKKGSEYKKVPVVVGRQSEGRAEILGGKVLPQDRVVTTGGHELSSVFFHGVLKIGPETERMIGLRMEPVAKRAIDRILHLDGRVDVPSDRRTSVSSQLGGKLKQIHVDRGQAVKAGDLLCEVASLELRDLQLDLLKHYLDLQMSRETLEARRTAPDGVARRVLVETEGRVSLLRIRVNGLRQQLGVIGISDESIQEMLTTGQIIDAIPVRAPIDGVVADFDRVLGEVIKADDSLIEIHDTSQAWLQAFVSERDSAMVRVGQQARVQLVAFPGLEATGIVRRIAPVVGKATRIQSAWIEIQDPPLSGIQHNMSARITLTTGVASDALAVPDAAIIRDGLRRFVFVRKPDGQFERRAVLAGAADDRSVEIIEGLLPGESVAVAGVQQLQTAFAAVR